VHASLTLQRLSQEKHTSDSDSVATGETGSPAACREPGEHGMAPVPSQAGFTPSRWGRLCAPQPQSILS